MIKKVQNYWIIYKFVLKQKDLLDTEMEFFIRDKADLDDVLYEADSDTNKKESALFFDSMDMVFI